jgi:hypothetical protein
MKTLILVVTFVVILIAGALLTEVVDNVFGFKAEGGITTSAHNISEMLAGMCLGAFMWAKMPKLTK